MSHWDTIATPNQLMEPAINSDLTHNVDKVDLTLSLMRDVGWFSDFDGVPDGRDLCPGSAPGSNISIAGCQTDVPNPTFTTGCRISDLIAKCRDTGQPFGAYQNFASSLTNDLKWKGIIDGKQEGDILSCVARDRW